MKLTFRLLGVSLRQAFIGWRFLLASICMAAMFIFPIYRMQVGIMDGISQAIRGTGAELMILALLPVIPFGSFYATEYTGGAMSFWTIRAGTKRYIGSKTVAAILSAMGVFVVGILLYVIVAFLDGRELMAKIQTDSSYYLFGYRGQPVLSLIFYVVHYMFSAGVWAAMGVFVSTCLPNLYVALAAPSVIYMLVMWFDQYWPPELGWCNPYHLTGYIYDQPDPVQTLLLHIGVCLVYMVILTLASVANGKRRQQNA